MSVSLIIGLPGLAQADQGIKISNGLLQAEVTGGQVITHVISVQANVGGGDLNIRVEARGLGQGTDGAFEPLCAEEDTSAFSAREFVTDIEPAIFSLTPGGTRDVSVTITVPKQLQNGTYYASIYVHTEEIEAEGSAIILAASAPLIITPHGSETIMDGSIQGLSVADAAPGQPIRVQTTFRNTGNHHFKAYNTITLTDSSGRKIAIAESPLTSSSIVRSYAYRFETGVIPEGTLKSGTYHVRSEVYHEDGTLLDTSETDFSLKIPWEIFPPVIVQDSIQTFSFVGETPGEINAASKSSIRIEFVDTGEVTGTVITARYDEEPQVPVSFSEESSKGGTGNEGILYSAVHIDGLSRGTALISYLYTDAISEDYDETSLYLAYWDGTRWRSLDNIRVYSGANYVTGEAPVTKLVGAPVGLGGIPVIPDVPESRTGLWIGLGAAVIAVLIVLAVIILRRRHR